MSVDIVDWGTTHAHVNRPIMGDSRPDDSFRFRSISRTDDGHVRQAAHDSHVFDGLVGRPVFAEAGMGRTDFDVEPRQADGVANLFKSTACTENSKGTGQGNLAASRKARCRTHHILFRNTHIEIALWRHFLKSHGPRRRTEIRVEDNNPGIFIQFCF